MIALLWPPDNHYDRVSAPSLSECADWLKSRFPSIGWRSGMVTSRHPMPDRVRFLTHTPRLRVPKPPLRPLSLWRLIESAGWWLRDIKRSRELVQTCCINHCFINVQIKLFYGKQHLKVADTCCQLEGLRAVPSPLRPLLAYSRSTVMYARPGSKGNSTNYASKGSTADADKGDAAAGTGVNCSDKDTTDKGAAGRRRRRWQVSGDDSDSDGEKTPAKSPAGEKRFSIFWTDLRIERLLDWFL